MKPFLLSLVAATAAAIFTTGAFAEGAPVVVFKTTHGDIKIQMNPEKAPKTVENFLKYVKDGYMDKTVFHRIVPGFVIQGGGFAKGDGHKHEQKRPNPPVVNESQNGLSNTLGTISMARTGDPNSATSQFFLNVADNSTMLDAGVRGPYGYAVFGTITQGLDVAKKIEAIPTTRQTLLVRAPGTAETTERPMDEVPTEDAIVLEAYIEGEKKPEASPAPAAKLEAKEAPTPAPAKEAKTK